MRSVRCTALLLAVLAVCVVAQSENPRFGRWKLKSDAPPPASNIMTYEPAPHGGMKTIVDSMNRQGQKGGWTYTSRLDGTDAPITGHPTADAAEVRVIDERVNEIIYKKDGKATQFLMNVLSKDGKTLTVTFRNPEGKITSVATYERIP